MILIRKIEQATGHPPFSQDIEQTETFRNGSR